jgi:hypothetical protein
MTFSRVTIARGCFSSFITSLSRGTNRLLGL